MPPIGTRDFRSCTTLTVAAVSCRVFDFLLCIVAPLPRPLSQETMQRTNRYPAGVWVAHARRCWMRESPSYRFPLW